MYFYTAHGLLIQSELQLPLLASNSKKSANLTILKGPVPKSLPNQHPAHDFRWWHKEKDQVLLRLIDVGWFLIESGKTITVEIASDVDEAFIILHLLGPAMSVALQQRGVYVLRAASLLIDETAVLILAKEIELLLSLAVHLSQHGISILSDKLSAIYFNEKGPYLYPGSTLVTLSEDSLPELNIDQASLKPVNNQTDRYFASLPLIKMKQPISISRLVFLVEEKQTVSIPSLQAINVAERMVSQFSLKLGIRFKQQLFSDALILKNKTPTNTLRVKKHTPIKVIANELLTRIKSNKD